MKDDREEVGLARCRPEGVLEPRPAVVVGVLNQEPVGAIGRDVECSLRIAVIHVERMVADAMIVDDGELVPLVGDDDARVARQVEPLAEQVHGERIAAFGREVYQSASPGLSSRPARSVGGLSACAVVAESFGSCSRTTGARPSGGSRGSGGFSSPGGQTCIPRAFRLAEGSGLTRTNPSTAAGSLGAVNGT